MVFGSKALYSSSMEFLSAGDYGIGLAIAYLSIHLAMLLAARFRPERFLRLLAVDLFLIGGLLGIRLLRQPAEVALLVRLWTPIIFFWWAYKWAGSTLHLFHEPTFTLDSEIIRLEDRYLGQSSLRWARKGSPLLTEVLHVFYSTYYLFTPLLAVYLYHKGRLLEFEKMALAVTLGYAVAYTSFALIPVWGPRWGLLREGLLEASEQKLRGYWITKGINYIMYQGIAHKGGAMPSAHSSTAVVFLVWCWWLWGPWGGVPAAFTVTGMWVGAVYCRYHYVLDIICGAVLGVASLWIVELAI